MSEQRKARVAVIREDLMLITGGNHVKALILNQFIYWAQRTRSATGWFHKSANQFVKEIFIPITEKTMRRYIQDIEKSGYVQSRNNPDMKWDRTMQYKVDLNAISDALKNHGYTLDGNMQKEASNPHGREKAIGPDRKGSGAESNRNERPDRKGSRAGAILKSIKEINTESTAAEHQEAVAELPKISVKIEQPEKLYTLELLRQHTGRTPANLKEFNTLKDLAELWPREAVEQVFIHCEEKHGPGGFGPGLVRTILTQWKNAGQLEFNIKKLSHQNKEYQQVKAQLIAEQQNQRSAEAHLANTVPAEKVDRVAAAWHKMTAKELDRILYITDDQLMSHGGQKYAHFFSEPLSYLMHYYPNHILLHHPASPLKKRVDTGDYLTYEQAQAEMIKQMQWGKAA